MVGVKDYHQSRKEYLVLSMVKKYPLYSLNKLAEELPGISRHSIQRILEKNNLSRAEQRLEFASSSSSSFLPVARRMSWIKEKVFDLKFDLNRIKKFLRRFSTGFISSRASASKLVVSLILIVLFWQGISYLVAKPPEISLGQPSVSFVNQGEKLFVNGKVVPSSSWVMINGEEVALNGDGSFTAVIKIPLGENTLTVEAINKGKKSRVLRLVKRILTEEELKAQEEAEARKKREAADRAAELGRTVNDLLAAKNANAGRKGFLRVLNSRVKEEAGFYSIVGEVANLGKEAVSWVMITVRFYNQSGGEVDRKYGFATDFGEVIKPGEKASFETQATTKEFDHYSLELSWEKGEVAGVFTSEEEATPSGGGIKPDID